MFSSIDQGFRSACSSIISLISCSTSLRAMRSRFHTSASPSAAWHGPDARRRCEADWPALSPLQKAARRSQEAPSSRRSCPPAPGSSHRRSQNPPLAAFRTGWAHHQNPPMAGCRGEGPCGPIRRKLIAENRLWASSCVPAASSHYSRIRSAQPTGPVCRAKYRDVPRRTHRCDLGEDRSRAG